MNDNVHVYSAEEARIDLVAALRTAERMGLSEGVCNHFSLALPGAPGHFLINPQGMHWSEVTPGDLVVVDAEVTTCRAGIPSSRPLSLFTVAFIAAAREHAAFCTPTCRTRRRSRSFMAANWRG